MLCRGRRFRRFRRLTLSLTLAAASPTVAQEPAAAPPATLTLLEAIDLARRNNPEYLATANNLGPADWAVRNAYGNLLPSADVSTYMGYTAAGNTNLGVVTSEALATDYYSSGYRMGVGYSLSGARLLAPGQARSNRRATAATIDAARFNLEFTVTREYLGVLRAQDDVVVTEQELARARQNLALAEARVQVEAAIPMEAKQAQVEVGTAEVALLQARNAVYTQRLMLLQLLGIGQDAEPELTTRFAVQDVPWTPEELLAFADATHPRLRAAEAQRVAAGMGVRMARTAYLPSLNLSAGWSAYARKAGNSDFLVERAQQSAQSQLQSCTLLNNISAGLSSPLPGTPADCSSFTLTPDDERAIRDANRLDLAREPFSMNVSLSLPIFNGFGRERQLEEARVMERDAELQLRAQRIQLRTEVATTHASLLTARRSVELQARNQELATEQLELARERYRLGVGTFLELQDAETTKARADRAQLQAVYDFHQALAALEAAVGRPLKQVAEAR